MESESGLKSSPPSPSPHFFMQEYHSMAVIFAFVQEYHSRAVIFRLAQEYDSRHVTNGVRRSMASGKGNWDSQRTDEFRTMDEPKDKSAEKSTGERFVTANMTQDTRLVHRSQRSCLFERYANVRRRACYSGGTASTISRTISSARSWSWGKTKSVAGPTSSGAFLGALLGPATTGSERHSI